MLPVSQLTSRDVPWLWPSWLAAGKLSILDGDPGLGKSLLALDLCARLTTGRAWPDGSPGAEPANVIILNGEDGPEDTIRVRLQRAGADLDRVFVPPPDQFGLPWRFPGQTDLLCAAVERTKAKLVVIDPIMAFLDSSVMTASDQHVRAALLPLAQLAEQLSFAHLLIRHLNKTSITNSVYRGGGSIGIVGACRMGWLVGVDPRCSKQRVLAQVKNNLAPPQPSLGYEIVTRDHGPPELKWLGPSPWSADEIVVRRRPTEADRACAFLRILLEKGPKTSRDIWKEAREQGLTENRVKGAERHAANHVEARLGGRTAPELLAATRPEATGGGCRGERTHGSGTLAWTAAREVSSGDAAG